MIWWRIDRAVKLKSTNNFDAEIEQNSLLWISMKKKITLKQIARELDVSVSTVSKALRDSEEIGKETRERVQAYAKYYNYRPNSIALSLKIKKSKNIGVIVPEIVHNFFSMVINGIENVANQKGYNVIVCFSNESFDREVINMETLANSAIDGFIVALTKETQQKQDYHHLREVINQGMPLVMFDRVTYDIYCDKVVVDDTYAAYSAVNYFLESGCSRIALLTVPDHISVGKLRNQGYFNALKDAGLPIREELIVVIDDIESAEEIRDLFDREKFDALLCVNEFFAATSLREAHDRGLRIPDDVSIIGFADGFLARNAYPKLTAIDQHGFEMGEKTAEMLIDKVENEEDDDSDEYFRTEVIRTNLVLRESTRKL